MFNEHQKRLWYRMVELIDLFSNGSISFSYFVGGLEGALDAAEIKDHNVIEQWYDIWSTFEIIFATRGDNVSPDEILKELICMKTFLINTISINVDKRSVDNG